MNDLDGHKSKPWLSTSLYYFFRNPTIVSTWLDRMFLITTTAHFQPIGSVDTVHSFYLFDRCSQPQYVRLVERLTVKGYFTNTFTISAYNQ